MRAWSAGRSVRSWPTPTSSEAICPGWIRRAESTTSPSPNDGGCLSGCSKVPGETRRVPLMSGDLPDDFVPRPTEYAASKDAVLSAPTGKAGRRSRPRCEARAVRQDDARQCLCRDPEVRFRIHRRHFARRDRQGARRRDRPHRRSDRKLDPDGTPPGFPGCRDRHRASRPADRRGPAPHGDRRCLAGSPTSPFLRGGPNCVRLVTTRLPQVLPRFARSRSSSMKCARPKRFEPHLSEPPCPAEPGRAAADLARLAERLGHWAQMIGIANGWIHVASRTGEPSPEPSRGSSSGSGTRAGRLRSGGRAQRNRAIRACVEASLEDLAPMSSPAFASLRSSPRKRTFRSMSSQTLWAETGGLDEDDTVTLVQRLPCALPAADP